MMKAICVALVIALVSSQSTYNFTTQAWTLSAGTVSASGLTCCWPTSVTVTMPSNTTYDIQYTFPTTNVSPACTAANLTGNKLTSGLQGGWKTVGTQQVFQLVDASTYTTTYFGQVANGQYQDVEGWYTVNGSTCSYNFNPLCSNCQTGCSINTNTTVAGCATNGCVSNGYLTTTVITGNPSTWTVNSCGLCSSNCATCNASTECTTCNSGYFVNNVSACGSCSTQYNSTCLTCTASSCSTSCTTQFNGNCTACTTTNCTACGNNVTSNLSSCQGAERIVAGISALVAVLVMML